MYMMGGDWNCSGLRRDIALEEWVGDQAEALNFLEFVRANELNIINQTVPGTGSHTRIRGVQKQSTLDIMIADDKTYKHVYAYHVDTPGVYNIASDHKLVRNSLG